MPTTTMTSKGQITIPKEIRDQVHARAGTQFHVRIDAEGNVLLEPKRRRLRELGRGFRGPPGVRLTAAEINESIADHCAEDHERNR